MDENELKAAFAAFLIDSATPLEAALKLYPNEADRGRACQISFAWPGDPVVIVELERIKKDGYSNKDIPTKEQVIAEVWRLAQNERVSPKDRGAHARLVAEMLNYIPKAADGAETSKRMPTQAVYKFVDE